MASVQPLADPADLEADEREAVAVLIKRLADDEFVIAERYTEWQVYAPTLESDLALSNIAQDELGHARIWYDVLEPFGLAETDLLWERDPETFVHATLTERPFEDGDWADPIVRSYLYDTAEAVRLDAVADSSYRPIADRVPKIRREEEYHREHAQSWLERLVATEDGHARVQGALDRLFPHALTIFTPVDEDVEARIDELGLRTEPLPALGEQWLETVVPFLESLALEPPIPESGEITDDLLPDRRGRDGNHDDAWFELYADFTHTYRELDRDYAGRIMRPGDDT